jgi:hypothetical protein
VANLRNVSLAIGYFKRNVLYMYFYYMFKLHCRVFMGLLLQTERGEYKISNVMFGKAFRWVRTILI